MLVTVDTGGTKTLVAGFKPDGTLGETTRFATPPYPSDYLETLRRTLEEKFAGETVNAIVIALPGTIKNNIAVWCQNLGWENFDVKAGLEGVLGDAPIYVENDANLAGLAETRVLDPMPRSSLYVTVSTGIGTGIITEGHIDPALRQSEGGHMLVEFGGEVREWESFGSGKAIKEHYGKFARDIEDDETWDEIADRISRGFLTVIPLLQPDVIIIGGSIGTYFDRYAHKLEAILTATLPSHIPCPEFKQAAHPEQAVLYGCYYYAVDTLDS